MKSTRDNKRGKTTMTQLQKLFEPIKVGNVEIKNRIAQAVFGGGCGYGKDDMVTDRLVNFFVERAKGGAGLLMVGTAPHQEALIFSGSGVGIYHDRFIPGLKRLTDEVHKSGAKIGTQLMCRLTLPTGPGGQPEFVGPSDVVVNPRGGPKPRPLTVEEIGQIVEEQGEGVRRAREAGFDLVEFFALAGNLVSQFMSPYTNKRTDEYGGSHERRLRFLIEIIECAQRKAGRDFPLIWRIP